MTPGQEPPLLTFQWRERESPAGRLLFYLALTVAGVAGFFMLFKVVYPQARHYNTAPQQVYLLDPTQAATRDIMNRTLDENFLLLGPDANPARTDGAAERLFPVFKPGFTGFEMKLVELPGVQDSKSLPRIFRIDDVPLPPVATVKKAAAPSARAPVVKSVVRAVPHGTLAQRGIAGSRDINATLPGGIDPPRFKVCVSSLGHVTFALPLDSMPDVKQMRALQAGMSSLRFKPVAGSAVQWGEVSLQWEPLPP
ncbi:MAG: hypothetical protein K1X78_03490 [Verrucomicrobiaceae bacterium]|nr:hypothetical protein [Verrucomicrobiaceae bacterium]